MYTFWGEITTLLVFFLLTACSIEKYAQSKSDATLCNGKLFKATSFWFQQAMMQEITITVLFWSFLYFIATDLKNMSWQMIKEKLYYDIVLDTDNYNHSIPIVLLMIEFGVNNIQFSWKHLAIHILSNVAYMVLQCYLSRSRNKEVYPGIDWINDPKGSAIKSHATLVVTLVFFFMIKGLLFIKFRLNGITHKIAKTDALDKLL
jgi:hypothetical protein